MLFLVLFHYSPGIKKGPRASELPAEGDFISGDVHPELFKNTDVLLILCIKAPNLKDKEV